LFGTLSHDRHEAKRLGQPAQFFFGSLAHDLPRLPPWRPNGKRISGERRAEGDERVRCMRVLGGAKLIERPLLEPREAHSPSSGDRYSHARVDTLTGTPRSPTCPPPGP
jgi:hypothetical protein